MADKCTGYKTGTAGQCVCHVSELCGHHRNRQDGDTVMEPRSSVLPGGCAKFLEETDDR